MDAVDAILVPDTKTSLASSNLITFYKHPNKFIFIDPHSLPVLIRYTAINPMVIVIWINSK